MMQEPTGIHAEARRLRKVLENEPWFGGIEIVEHEGKPALEIWTKDTEEWMQICISSSYPYVVKHPGFGDWV